MLVKLQKMYGLDGGLQGQQYCYKPSKFQQAIEKYGFDNFEHIIVANGLTKEEVNCLEKELILKYNFSSSFLWGLR